jgi:predicted SAM-dependent methyltransferase
MTKLHLGCGPVYLEDYMNIDIESPGHYLASDRPDLVTQNKTTVENYYRHTVTREDIEQKRLQKQEVVCDRFMDVADLWNHFEHGSISEIRIVQVFEHFTWDKGKELLRDWFLLLATNGTLHIDVPDLQQMWQDYIANELSDRSSTEKEKERNWLLRLMFGSMKNPYSIHHSVYTADSLIASLREAGFEDIQEKPNIHFYPAFALEATKL